MAAKKDEESGDKSAQAAKKTTKKKAKKKRAKDKAKEFKIETSANVTEIRDLINKKVEGNVAEEVVEKPAVVLPTGILSMDLAVNNGGLLGGRIMDIHGWEGTGKTLVCMTIGGYIQRCQKLDANGNVVNRMVAFLDAEGTFSPAFAQSAGLDTDNLILVKSTPDRILSGEDYFDIIVTLLQIGIDYIIVDSCPALTPSQVLVNETGQGQKATRAAVIAQGLERITPYVNATGHSLVHFINQKRNRPMAKPYESSESETGGNALKFFSSYRFEVTGHEDIMKNVLGADGEYRGKKVGVRSKVRVIKNKTAPIPPFLPSSNFHFDFDVYFEDFQDDEGMEYHRGVDVVKDYIDTGILCGVIEQNSSWFKFGDIKANGKTAMIQEIRAKPEVMTEIRDAVFSRMKVTVPTAPVPDQEQPQAAVG